MIKESLLFFERRRFFLNGLSKKALWHLDALCYEGCEGHGSANALPQPRMELAERSHEQTYFGRYC